MKLLMIARRFPPDVQSGTETVFANLWQRARARHEVRLVAGWVRDRAMIPGEALGVSLAGLPKGAAHLAMARAISAEARRFRPDVVLSNAIEVPLLRAPTAILVHDLNFGRAGRGWAGSVRERLYAWRSERAQAVITPSRATRDALLRVGVSQERISVIHNGVDTEAFAPRPWTERGGDLVVAYPGRILPGKGQHLAIDAVARLTMAEKKRVRLMIAGAVADPVYFAQLKVQARGQPVSFHPDVEDLAPYYQQADLVLFPTMLREGFGYTAVEAMACGRPVVWTDQTAIREATGGIGFPVPPDDALALRTHVRAALQDVEPYRRAGAEGRAFVERWYGWERVYSAYEEVLMRLDRRRGPR